MRALEPWVVQPLETFLAESGARLTLLMTSSGQVVAQHGFSRSLDVMTAAALGAGIVASTEELARLMGAARVEALVHNGQRQSCMLAAFATPRGRWIGLVVFGPETSVGIVRLFFDQMVQQLAAVAPREQQPQPPMLAENFETELNASLKALFGR
jgi:predicted regulator of Ras-like GTPase activity (Roadblock/LC7/MglB family)